MYLFIHLVFNFTIIMSEKNQASNCKISMNFAY